MTVGELIVKLQEYDPNLKVKYWQEDTEPSWEEVETVEMWEGFLSLDWE